MTSADDGDSTDAIQQARKVMAEWNRLMAKDRSTEAEKREMIAEVRTQLEPVVRSIFEQRIQHQREQIAKMQKRLARLQARLAKQQAEIESTVSETVDKLTSETEIERYRALERLLRSPGRSFNAAARDDMFAQQGLDDLLGSNSKRSVSRNSTATRYAGGLLSPEQTDDSFPPTS